MAGRVGERMSLAPAAHRGSLVSRAFASPLVPARGASAVTVRPVASGPHGRVGCALGSRPQESPTLGPCGWASGLVSGRPRCPRAVLGPLPAGLGGGRF